MIAYRCLGCGKPDLPIEAPRCPKCGEENFIPLNRSLSASESRPEPINDTNNFFDASTEHIGEANTTMTDCSSNQHEQTELIMKDISLPNEEHVDGFEKTNVEVERDGGAETTNLQYHNTGLKQEQQLPTRNFDPVLRNNALQDISSAYDHAYSLNAEDNDVCDSVNVNLSATASAHGEEPENGRNSSHQPQSNWENQPSTEMAVGVDEWSQFKNEDGEIDFAGCRRCLRQFCAGTLSFDGDSKPYKCDKCLCRFDRRCALNRHLAVHSKERPFKCGQCNFAYKRRGDLDVHILNVHTKRENKSSAEVASGVDALSQFKNEDGEIDFSGCSKCSKQFRDVQLSFDGDSKPYKCDKCLCRFDQRFLLKKHLVVHSKERPFKCEQCDFTYKRRGDLNVHILNVHTKRENKSSAEVASGVDELSQFKNEDGEIDFAGCNKCLKRFRDGQLSFNGDPKAYKCEKCLCSFSEHCYLKRHLAVHSKDRPFECGHCVYTCKRKEDLVSHNLIYHTKQ